MNDGEEGFGRKRENRANLLQLFVERLKTSPGLIRLLDPVFAPQEEKEGKVMKGSRREENKETFNLGRRTSTKLPSYSDH